MLRPDNKDELQEEDAGFITMMLIMMIIVFVIVGLAYYRVRNAS
ncbi:MAG: hypothetical protein AAF413_03455 [Patescibacteria group bacterium]